MRSWAVSSPTRVGRKPTEGELYVAHYLVPLAPPGLFRPRPALRRQTAPRCFRRRRAQPIDLLRSAGSARSIAWGPAGVDPPLSDGEGSRRAGSRAGPRRAGARRARRRLRRRAWLKSARRTNALALSLSSGGASR